MVIKRDHYVNQVIAKRWMSYMSRCVKRRKMDDIKERRIERLLTTTTWALVVAVCVMVFVVIMLAMR